MGSGISHEEMLYYKGRDEAETTDGVVWLCVWRRRGEEIRFVKMHKVWIWFFSNPKEKNAHFKQLLGINIPFAIAVFVSFFKLQNVKRKKKNNFICVPGNFCLHKKHGKLGKDSYIRQTCCTSAYYPLSPYPSTSGRCVLVCLVAGYSQNSNVSFSE